MQKSPYTPDTLGRRSRMRANSTGKRIRLTTRDWIWLEVLHRHGPLSSKTLQQYTKSICTSKKRTTERLTDLFHESDTKHGGTYLTRPQQQFQTIDARYNPLVYDLAPAGIRALKETERFQDTAGPNGGPWWHRFMIAHTTASIELATLSRSDVSFIPQSNILERAQTTLAYTVSYKDQRSGNTLTKQLIPDALFGLEYHTPRGSRYRFFLVEADRGTEPLTSSNTNRKSFQRHLAMYEAYITGGAYKRHLNLTAPLLVLNVCNSEKRVESLQATQAKCGWGQSYQLYGVMGSCFTPQMLLSSHWQRTARPALRIDRC